MVVVSITSCALRPINFRLLGNSTDKISHFHPYLLCLSSSSLCISLSYIPCFCLARSGLLCGLRTSIIQPFIILDRVDIYRLITHAYTHKYTQIRISMKVLRLVCFNSFLLLVSLLVRVVSTSLMAFVRFSFPCISWLQYKRFLPLVCWPPLYLPRWDLFRQRRIKS